MKSSDVGDMFLNPYHATVFAPYLFEGQKRAATHEDWVLLNAQLIEDMGAKAWLKELLDVLSSPKAEYDGHDIINPVLTIKISDRLQGGHIFAVTPEQWVETNVKLMNELSPATWLYRLLNVLETGSSSLK